MKETTRYAYEKRIKELENQVENLKTYKSMVENIFYHATNIISEGKTMSMGWLVNQFKVVFK